MHAVLHLAVLCVMVVPFPVLVCSQDPAPGSNGPEEKSGTARPGISTRLTASTLQQRAEQEQKKARSLRDGETGSELRAAIVSFQKSALLFHTSHLDHQAAEAILEIGDL